MITYDWKKIWWKSEADPSKILDIIEYLAYKPIPKNKYDNVMHFVDIDWSGISFILHPEPIIQYRIKQYEKELAEYVALASFRSLAEYKATKRTTLYLEESPLTITSLNDNRFLTLENDTIHFRWEEATN